MLLRNRESYLFLRHGIYLFSVWQLLRYLFRPRTNVPYVVSVHLRKLLFHLLPLFCEPLLFATLATLATERASRHEYSLHVLVFPFLLFFRLTWIVHFQRTQPTLQFSGGTQHRNRASYERRIRYRVQSPFGCR